MTTKKLFKKAIRETIPQATNVMCTRHLRSNFDDHLKNKKGVNVLNRVKILKSVFGREGLCIADDSIVFQSIKQQVERNLQLLSRLDYFVDRIYPLVRDFVFIPRQKYKLPRSWTNNNSESANFMIKKS